MLAIHSLDIGINSVNTNGDEEGSFVVVQLIMRSLSQVSIYYFTTVGIYITNWILSD